MAWHGVARHVLACAGRRQLTTTWFDMATGSRSAQAQAQARASYLEYGTGGAQGRACVRQLVALCWLLAVGGDGCPGRQRHSSSCRYGRLRARFVKLLRFCLLTTDMEFAGGGSCATGASAFTMVVVVSGGSVLVFVRPRCSELIRAEALASWHPSLIVAGHNTANQPARTWVWSLYYVYCHI
jgi:hypothetical protein